MDKCQNSVIASSDRLDTALVTESCCTELKDERIPAGKQPKDLRYLQRQSGERAGRTVANTVVDRECPMQASKI